MQAGDANGCQISSVVILLSQMEVSSCVGVVVVANPVVQSLLSELYPLMFVGSPVQPIWSAVWVPGERYYWRARQPFPGASPGGHAVCTWPRFW